jgi:hypothetical protein
MTKHLRPYGSSDHVGNVSKVGKSKSPASLAERMPSPDLLAKVGVKQTSPASLAERMPSVEVAAKVGINFSSNRDAPRVRRKNRVN